MIPELQEEMTIKDSYITKHVELTTRNVKVGGENTKSGRAQLHHVWIVS